MRTAKEALPNELLSYEREQHHWTQDEVAERIGAPDGKMVGKWERGIIVPTPRYRQKLELLFKKSGHYLGFTRKGEIPFGIFPIVKIFSLLDATLSFDNCIQHYRLAGQQL